MHPWESSEDTYIRTLAGLTIILITLVVQAVVQLDGDLDIATLSYDEVCEYRGRSMM